MISPDKKRASDIKPLLPLVEGRKRKMLINYLVMFYLSIILIFDLDWFQSFYVLSKIVSVKEY